MREAVDDLARFVGDGKPYAEAMQYVKARHGVMRGGDVFRVANGGGPKGQKMPTVRLNVATMTVASRGR